MPAPGREGGNLPVEPLNSAGYRAAGVHGSARPTQAHSSFSLTSGSPGAGEAGYDLFLNHTGNSTQNAPEPASVAMAAIGVGSVVTRRRRRKG